MDIKLLCEQDGVFPYNQAASGVLFCRGGGGTVDLEVGEPTKHDCAEMALTEVAAKIEDQANI